MFSFPERNVQGRLPYGYEFCCNQSGQLPFTLIFLHTSVPHDTQVHYFLHMSTSRCFNILTWRPGAIPVWHYIFCSFIVSSFLIIHKTTQISNYVTRHPSDMSWHQLADAWLHTCACPEWVNVAAVVLIEAQISGKEMNYNKISFLYPPTDGNPLCHKIFYEFCINPCGILELKEVPDITICCGFSSRNIAGVHN